MSSDLYDHPRLYDVLLPAGGHVPYYLELARRAGGDVLELACGSGQLTVPLAGAGVPIIGLDLSGPMLKAARDRAKAAGVEVEFAHGDMRDFEFDRKFGLIFVARNSLLHLHSTEDLATAFAAVRRHLAPGGVFAFDIFNPKVGVLARTPGPRHPVMQVESEEFGLLTVESTHDYDAATQVDRARWYVSAPGKPDAWMMPLELRSIFPQELPLLLGAGGFRLVNRWGELDESPFHSKSRVQVCVCEAA